MEKDLQLYNPKYQIVLIKGEGVVIDYKQYVRIVNVLYEGKQKFIRLGDDYIIAVNQIAQITKIKEDNMPKFDPPTLSEEERQKAIEKYQNLKKQLKMRDIID